MSPASSTADHTDRTAFRIPPVSELYTDGVFVRSKIDGRYITFRGMCFGPAAKLDPFLPLRSVSDFEKFDDYIKLLLECGFTTLRMPFIWQGFEPTCNPDRPEYNEAYFKQFFEITQGFTDRGFTVFIDIHQDLVQSTYGGSGFPLWLREDHKKKHRPLFKNTPWWGLNYVINKSLRRTFTQFWKNDLTNTSVNPPLVHFPVRERFLHMIERVAEASAKNPRILGIEVFNEPHPAEFDSETFEREVLSHFYTECIARIRKYSSDMFVMLSPQSDWNVNLRSDKNYKSYLDLSAVDDDRLMFAYHYYDSLLTGLHGLHFGDHKRDEYREAIALGVRAAKEKKMIPFLTEFGSRQNWFRSVTERHMDWHFEAIERACANATYWNVNFYNTKNDRDGFMREDFSILDDTLTSRNLEIATRPYIAAASAEPVQMTFNLHTLEFEAILEGKPVSEQEHRAAHP